MIVLAVVLAVIATLLFIPIRIYVSYHATLRLWVRVLFLRFDIIPRRKKKKEKPEKTEKPYSAPFGEEVPEPQKQSPPEEEKPAPPKEKNKDKKPEKDTDKKVGEKPVSSEEAEEKGLIDRFLE
ncbi:MAG: hypothetical protein ACI4SS_01690, partial [Clostridia bacterium]